MTKPLPHEINALMDCGTGSTDLLLPAAGPVPATSGGAAATGTAAATPAPPLLTYTVAAATSPQLAGGIKGMAPPPLGATSAATLSDNSFMAAGICGIAAGGATTATTGAGAAAIASSGAGETLSALLNANSSGAVDIMEDEEEQERERLRYVPQECGN